MTATNEQQRVDVVGLLRAAAIEAPLLGSHYPASAFDEARVAVAELIEALEHAEAALADIGDADREPGDNLAWCERRAAEPLPKIRAALANVGSQP